MERRTWIASTGAIACTVVAAALALAANLGILHAGASSPTTVLTTGGSGATGAASAAAPGGAEDEPEVVHLTVRDLPPTGTGTTPGRPAASPTTTAAPVAGASAPTTTTTAVRPRETESRRGSRHDEDDD